MRTQIGPWEFDFHTDSVCMTEREMDQLLKLILQWEQVFVREPNGVAQKFGKPSLLVRIDYALQDDGTVGVYEVEERPCGIGMGVLCHPYFKEHFTALFRQWQEICGSIELIVSPERIHSSDDHEWADELGIKVRYTPEIDGAYYWVRADPPDTIFHELVPRALTTIITEGDKRYGVPLNLWGNIPDDISSLPWEEGFALKPLQGSRMQNLYLWNPKGKKEAGLVTRGKIAKVIEEGKVAFVQEWLEPERPTFLPERSFLLRRVFFGWNLMDTVWECLGGFYTVRNRQYRLHGASDALFGMIVPSS